MTVGDFMALLIIDFSGIVSEEDSDEEDVKEGEDLAKVHDFSNIC